MPVISASAFMSNAGATGGPGDGGVSERSALRDRRGFTLIELLVVMAILSSLMGMLMPMYGIVRKSSSTSRTQAVLKKVEIGLRQYKTEWGAYPYQGTYPSTISPGSPFANNLLYRIGTDISTSDRAKVVTDMDAASSLFAYCCSIAPGGNNSASFTEGAQPSTFTYTWAKEGTAFYNLFLNGTDLAWQGNNYGAAWMLNQAAQEQARLAIAAGDVAVRGQLVCSNATTVVLNNTASALLAAPASAGISPSPGMAADYLHGEIEKSSLSGNDIIDAWNHPLVYICQCVPGMQGEAGALWNFQVPGYDTRYMGLGCLGFDPATGPGPGLISGGRPLLIYSGRVKLCQSPDDAGDGLGATPTDATYMPSNASLGHSDVRYYAAPGYQTEFELWSCGQDGSFSYMRDDPANLDNVSAVAYNRGLGLPGASP